MRIHAATHDGHLPDQLANITVPIPEDPTTGQPFTYHVTDDKAILQSPTFRGFTANYEITMAK